MRSISSQPAGRGQSSKTVSQSPSCFEQIAQQPGERDLNGYLHRPREELYDLEKDPHELKNVAADPADQKVLADLRIRLKEWQSVTKDRWQIKYEHE
jgi:hypothetical protein